MSDFDLRQFREFCTKVFPELASFLAIEDSETRAEAGTRLGIDGTAVTKAIRRLEVRFAAQLNGGSLIDHGEPRILEPTEAGLLFLEYIHEVRDRSQEFSAALETLQRGTEIRLAMTRSAWLAYGTELQAAYTKRCPGGILNFGNEFYSRDRVWDEIENNVLENRVDIGIYSFPPSRQKKDRIPKGLAIQPLADEEIVLVVPGNYPKMPKGFSVSPAALPTLDRVVHYRRSLGFDRTTTIEAYLKQQNVLRRFKGDWLLGVDTISEIKDTLVRKGGISFLPWPDVEHEHNQGTLRAYRLQPRMRSRLIRIVYRLHASRPAIVEFLKAASRLEKKREFRSGPSRWARN